MEQKSLHIQEHVVNLTIIQGEDYICLTDMARIAGAERALLSWLRNKNTISFLGLWEQLNNPQFKVHEFVYFSSRAGINSFNPSISEWIEKTGAVGIVSKRGRYGGTYAHKDIAFELGTWLSPEFKLLLITEFQKLKANEHRSAQWDAHRYLARINYRLHTDAIKNVLLPALLLNARSSIFVYSSEADMLNHIVFGQTATQWKQQNLSLSENGQNQRDTASTEQLVILANLESLNAHLIANQINRRARFKTLVAEAQRQYQTLIDVAAAQKNATFIKTMSLQSDQLQKVRSQT